MRAITIIFALFAFSLVGCGLDPSGSWDIEIIDGAETLDGEMDIFVEDGRVDGSIDIELYYACADVHGDVSGTMEDDTMSLTVDFDEWHCEGYIIEFYDMEVPTAEMIDDGSDIVELDGDGDWGEAAIRFTASR